MKIIKNNIIIVMNRNRNGTTYYYPHVRYLIIDNKLYLSTLDLCYVGDYTSPSCASQTAIYKNKSILKPYGNRTLRFINITDLLDNISKSKKLKKNLKKVLVYLNSLLNEIEKYDTFKDVKLNGGRK